MPYHYHLDGPLLEITCSDSKQEHVDEGRIRDVDNHPDGRKSHHVQRFNDSRVSKLWRKQLGEALAIKFLFKPNNSLYPIFCNGGLLPITPLVDYILAKFPKGYLLYSHEKGNNHEVDRSDAYLFGMCLHLPVSHSLLTYIILSLQVITSSFALQQNLSPMLPGLLLACPKVVVSASTAAIAKGGSPRHQSIMS